MIKYFYDKMRHLVCEPYSVEGLHEMATKLGIKRCWFHAGKRPHYDIPKRRMKDIGNYAKLVSPKRIFEIISSA